MLAVERFALYVVSRYTVTEIVFENLTLSCILLTYNKSWLKKVNYNISINSKKTCFIRAVYLLIKKRILYITSYVVIH